MGDQFLKDVFPAYPAIKEQAIQNKNIPGIPAIYLNYNMTKFTPDSIGQMCSSVLARILNRLIDAINIHHILPRFIVIMPDWDILWNINYFDFGVSRIIGDCLEWLVREIDRIITTKKLDVSRKCVGAVMPTEPKIMWFAMIAHPSPSHLLALQRKFNVVLEETLSKA